MFPLHLAIVNGHVDVVQELVQNFGADVLLPIKLAISSGGGTAMLTLVLALQLPAAKAEEMAQMLLKLGASSAQADMNQVTALHYYAATGSDCLHMLFEHDAPAVKRALNHLAVGGNSYNCSAISPLMAAIEARNALGALKLLTAGAAPSVDFDKFMKSYQTKFENEPYYGQDPEQHQKRFKKQVEQPIILAVDYELPAVVLELLRRGVDSNTLARLAHQRVDNDYVSDQYAAGSLLDRVQAKITQLKTYLNLDKKNLRPTVEQLQDDAYYLKGLVEGSYKYWFAKTELQVAKKNIKREQEQNERIGKSTEEKQGEKEKREAAKNLMAHFEVVLAQLENKGAKTFKELYPDTQEHPTGLTYQYNYKPAKAEPFAVKFSFQVPDLTETRKEGYLELFQAAWSGDLATIKKLTLGPWGPDADRVPLKIAVQDSKRLSPFHVAVLRGHLPVAKAILEVAQAQYQPKAAPRRTYAMDEDDGNSDEDSEGDSDSIHVYSTLVDDQFTIDNIGEVSTQVKSDVTPVAMLNRRCPVWSMVGEKDGQHLHGSLLRYAINVDDIDLARYLLDLGVEFSTHYKDDNESSSIYSVSYSDFTYAMELGRTQILADMIKRTGAGIPLDDLVKKSGVEVVEKPKYYRGLSVHGKKRADWAAAGRGERVPSQPTVKHPPLLEAAYSGSIESVEWFLSDAPMRHYSAFASANKCDERLQNLAKAPGGIDQSISTWLATRDDLLIHCAILSNPSDSSVDLINYLARADPTIRDHRGNNVLHSLLCPISNQGRIYQNDKYLKETMELLDPTLLATLATQRSADGPGSATPLARWMKSITNNSWHPNHQRFQSSIVDEDKHTAVLRILLAFSSSGEELALTDGAGDTPLHTAVRMKAPRLLELMLEKRPDLLYRENATGRTPAEMAQDVWVHQVVWNAPKLKGLDSYSMYNPRAQGLVDRSPETFVEEKDERSDERKVWDVCQKWMEKEGAKNRKRKLVSLFEANEVAKRVAAQQGSRGALEYQKSGDEEDEDKRDEVTAWYAEAAQWEDSPSYHAPSPW
ncbi:hypothetical protein H2199_005354 [Coniosporium tulheliwenetii]|uniref:Uncharacterized protein n=1 Tax=Coniosporium tulheliwenetii TaxID=3383036 RepID=A0ACC2Z1C1_9PEZI|nr:hypothetical protein H2199_005354 [Cladosporium sp. JES 115]